MQLSDDMPGTQRLDKPALPKLEDAIANIVASFAGREAATVDEVLDLARRLSDEFNPAFRTLAVPQDASTSTQALGEEVRIAKAKPVIPIEKAVTPDTVYCLCCGRGFTMLKRHLKAEHGLTEDRYRAMFDLPEDFPLVAPNYSARKANYAKKIGLGKYSRDGMTADAETASN